MRRYGEMSRISCRMSFKLSKVVVLCAVLAYTMWLPLQAQQDPMPQPPGCVVSGKIISGTMAIPGVSVTVRAGERLVAATSTAVDGTYRLTVPTGATYQMLVEMTAFAKGEREMVAAGAPCAQTADFALVLASRVAGATVPPVPAPAQAEQAALAMSGGGRDRQFPAHRVSRLHRRPCACDRGAQSTFSLRFPQAFEPGLYTRQINVIDEVSGQFAFPRVTFYVR